MLNFHVHVAVCSSMLNTKLYMYMYVHFLLYAFGLCMSNGVVSCYSSICCYSWISSLLKYMIPRSNLLLFHCMCCCASYTPANVQGCFIVKISYLAINFVFLYFSKSEVVWFIDQSQGWIQANIEEGARQYRVKCVLKIFDHANKT